MLSEINQSQKDEYCMILFIRGTKSSQNHGERKSNSGCQVFGIWGNGELLFNGNVISIL